jgi:hypothetical protein
VANLSPRDLEIRAAKLEEQARSELDERRRSQMKSLAADLRQEAREMNRTRA